MRPTEDQSHVLSDNDMLLKQSLGVIYLFAAIVHLIFLFIFIKLEVKEMQYANYFSPAFYIIAFLLNRSDRIVFGASVAIGEAVMHGILSLFFVGWQAYFHIYIILVYLLIFFLYRLNLILRISFTLIVTLLYIVIFIYSAKNEPRYAVPQTFLIICGVVNILSTAAVLSIFAVTYSHFIRRNIKLLKNAEQQQRTLNAQKNRFFSIFSHDLKNPITTLNGFVDLILLNYDILDDTKRKDFLVQIQNSVGDLQKLVTGLLEWSRSQLDNIQLYPIKIDVGPTMLEIKSLFEHHAIQKNISLEIYVDSNITVFADENMFRSVMRNLISNAIKFTPHNGKVIVKVITNVSSTVIDVTDTGIGIPSQNIDKLFTIDKKLLSLGTDKETGTGLGLIVVKEFVEKNNGTIEVKSIPEQGTTFTVTLPSK